MKYQVVQNGKTADRNGFQDLKAECWSNSLFDTFEEAQLYANDWLGQYKRDISLDPFEVGVPFYFNGPDDFVEIVERKDSYVQNGKTKIVSIEEVNAYSTDRLMISEVENGVEFFVVERDELSSVVIGFDQINVVIQALRSLPERNAG